MGKPPEVVEEKLCSLFEMSRKDTPSVILVDDLDRLGEGPCSLIVSLMDELSSEERVFVIGTATSLEELPRALMRGGRLDFRVELGVPGRIDREEILEILTKRLPLSKDFIRWKCQECGDEVEEGLKLCSRCGSMDVKAFRDMSRVADATHGFVGADLAALCREAVIEAVNKSKKGGKSSQEARVEVRFEDFAKALKRVEPTATREITTEVPKVKWSDVGGLEEIVRQLKEIVEWPLKDPDMFKRLGISPPKGILLYGAPGTGKTLLARAAASECGASFIGIKGPELLSKFVGESERAIREIFRKGKQVAPAIIFFDEIDALAPRRSGEQGGSRVSERVVAQLLTEMDGVEDMGDIVVLAATNRPDLLDLALLRPGRFDRLIEVPLPDENARLSIVKIHTKDMPLSRDVNLEELARVTKGLSGADIRAISTEAGLLALREDIRASEVAMRHFLEATKKVLKNRGGLLLKRARIEART